MYQNVYTKTHPIVFHAPGRARRSKLWGELVRSCPTCEKRENTDKKNYEIITWSTTESKSCLEKCLDTLSESYTVLRKDKKDWSNIDKVFLTLEYLKTCKSEYIIGLDAFDVVLNAYPAEIIKRFNTFDCDLLFNAAPFQYPRNVPMLADCDKFENSFNEKYGYLNAGCWVGKTAYALEFFQKVADVNRDYFYLPKYQNSEQPSVKYAAFPSECPRVDIDRECIIFQHMMGYKDLRLINKPKQDNCIYTVLVGDYETLKIAPNYDGWDAIAFVDNVNIPARGWQLRELPIDDKLGAVRTSRLPRILPHKYLSDYDSSIYIDASIVINTPPRKWIPQDAKWAAARHWERANVWQEIDANIINEKVHIETAKNQEREYKDNGLMSKHIPLFQNCVLYRKHNNQKVIETCERWWYHFNKGTCRDQLSSPMAFADTGLIPSEITPRPKNSKGIHWTIYYEGTHKDVYRNFNLYFMIFNLRGSMISRGIQIGKCLFDRGIRNKVVTPAALDEIKDSTVIVVKELNRYITKLKLNNNFIIFDIVDNKNVWKNGLGEFGKMIDAVIFPTKTLMIDWQEKGWLKNKHSVVIDHHGDTRFEPNVADKFNPICISTASQIPEEVFELEIDCIDDRHGWEGMFDETLKYNLHIGAYKEDVDYWHKPPSKLVTAAACNANIILQRTPANIALMPEYPYYIDNANEIPAMLNKCRIDYEMQNQDWLDGLKIIAEVKEKTSGNNIASHYEKFLSLFVVLFGN